MLKHLLKSFGILLIVFLTSSNLSAQTTVTIINNNADCEFDYKVYYNNGTCTGTLVLLSGTCIAGNTEYETIPIGYRLNRVVIVDGSGNATVLNPNCGSTSSSYTNCFPLTSYVDLVYSTATVTVYE